MAKPPRPSKRQAVPAPYYLLTDGKSMPYCHTCGRVISSRKGEEKSIKYCSKSCRSKKPGNLERQIEDTFVRLLSGVSNKGLVEPEGDPQSSYQKHDKDSRFRSGGGRLVSCSVAEKIMFPERRCSTEYWQGGQEEPQSNMQIQPGKRDVEAESINDREAPDVDDVSKSKQGQEAANRREMVKQAARRGVVFGFDTALDDHNPELRDQPGREQQRTRRKCEAVMDGRVVEPSFAKGDWAIRWRD